jgi:biopolymer transport protein ExbB
LHLALYFWGPKGFKTPGEGAFWPKHRDPKGALNAIYMGGIIVPILLGMLLMVIVFSIERFLTVRKALGNGSVSDFIRRVQYHLANRNVDSALSECDKQRGSVANVMKAGLRRYKEMIGNTELNTDQKVLAIQKKSRKRQRWNFPCFKKILFFFLPLLQ